MTKLVKVNIIYGVFGGERLGRRLRKGLKAAGFQVVKNSKDADIILAHSAGCFWLQDTLPHQKLVLVNPPYWPGRTVRERGRRQTRAYLHYRRLGYQTHRWVRKQLWGVYYAVRDAKRTIRIIRYVGEFDLKAIIKNKDVLLVRNEKDTWLTNDLSKLEQSNPRLRVTRLTGQHDDWYFNPQPYINLLQSIV